MTAQQMMEEQLTQLITRLVGATEWGEALLNATLNSVQGLEQGRSVEIGNTYSWGWGHECRGLSLTSLVFLFKVKK
jgi:hypothetical protein